MHIERRDYELLYGILKRIKKHGPPDITLGICAAIRQYGGSRYEELDHIFEKLYKKWPKYSGFEGYPVPEIYDPTNKAKMRRGASEAFFGYHDVWTPINPYAKNRLELLDFCIEECKKILKQ